MNLHAKNLKFAAKAIPKRSIRAIGLLLDNKKTIWHLLKKSGIRAAYNFAWTKVFVKEAGPAVINPLFSIFPSLAPYPAQIEIEVTTRCHLKCAFCEHRYWTEKPADMSFENFKYLVGQFPRLKWVGFAGIGSNFLNQDYIKMLKYLKDKGVYVSFVDHFDRTTEEISRQLVDLGVNHIEISMDGATKETYESIKVGCNFERTLKNISNLVKIKKEKQSPLPEIMFRYIVTKQNIKEAPDFVKIVSQIKKLGKLREDRNAELEFTGLLAFEGNKEYALDSFPQEIKEKIAFEAKKEGVSISFAHQNPKNKRPRHTCAAWVEPFIFADGEVMACCAQNENNKRENQREKSFGNVFKTPFRQIWYSKKYKDFRANVPRHGTPAPKWCEGCRITDI